jgi:hypothetical protein
MRTPTSTRTCKQDAQTLQGIPMTHCMHVSSSSSYMTHVPMRCRYTYMRTHTRTYMQGGGQRAGEKENHATTGITQREREREREREGGRGREGERRIWAPASNLATSLSNRRPCRALGARPSLKVYTTTSFSFAPRACLFRVDALVRTRCTYIYIIHIYITLYYNKYARTHTHTHTHALHLCVCVCACVCVCVCARAYMCM